MMTHEHDLNASDASPPWKAANYLTHLPIRARVLVGQLVNVLSRDVLAQLLQHLHRMMTVLMTLSCHRLIPRNIQVRKLLRRVVAGEKVSVKMTVSRA
jgi:hypothetical protein